MNGKYPRICDCHEPPVLIANKQRYYYHKKMSVQVTKKARIDEMEKAKQFLDVNIPTYKKLVERDGLRTDTINILLNATDGEFNDSDPEFTNKIRDLALQRIEAWSENKVQWDTLPQTNKALRVFNSFGY